MDSTLSEIFAVTLLVAADSLLLALSARHWADGQRRAANLAVFNLIPANFFGLPAHLLEFRRSSFAWMQ
jgi:hypothetical protein